MNSKTNKHTQIPIPMSQTTKLIELKGQMNDESDKVKEIS